MNELKNGIIKIGDFTITPNTKINDVIDFYKEKSRVLDFGDGDKRVKLSNCIYINENMYIHCFDFENDTIKKFAILCSVPEEITSPEKIAKYSLEKSKEWLKGAMDVEPTSEGDNSILYSFEWGLITAKCYKDREYGVIGGNIEIEYRDK